MFKSHPYLRPLLTYSLPPLNLCLLTLTILLLHATLHPTTSAPSYFLRSHGNSSFTTLKIVIHAVSALVGLLNAFHLHRLLTTPAARYDSLKRTLTIHPPHPLPRVRLHHVFILFVCAAAAGYLLIAQLAFTEPFAEMAWSGTCNGYELMAEVEVLPGWYDGSEGSVFGAGSRITYFESVGEQGWREMAVREVVRHYRMEPGFNLYRRGSPERERFGEMAGWGLLDVRLVVGGGGTGEGRYWNETGLVGGGNATMVNGTAVNGTVVVGNATVRGSNGTEVAARGRIGGLRLDLKSSTYDATYTNTTHPHLTGSYDILPKNLTFPGLHLEHAQPGSEWRFTDHVCLPPRVALGDPSYDDDNDDESSSSSSKRKVDVRGELGDGCSRYRMCALKRAYPDRGEEGEGDSWWEWVEDVWPVVTGVVAWEVEKWSACCLRDE